MGSKLEIPSPAGLTAIIAHAYLCVRKPFVLFIVALPVLDINLFDPDVFI